MIPVKNKKMIKKLIIGCGDLLEKRKDGKKYMTDLVIPAISTRINGVTCLIDDDNWVSIKVIDERNVELSCHETPALIVELKDLIRIFDMVVPVEYNQQITDLGIRLLLPYLDQLGDPAYADVFVSHVNDIDVRITILKKDVIIDGNLIDEYRVSVTMKKLIVNEVNEILKCI